jgi:putative adhesin
MMGSLRTAAALAPALLQGPAPPGAGRNKRLAGRCILFLSGLLAGGCIVIDEFECRLREERSAVMPAPANLAVVEITALSGSLAIHGHDDATEIRVSGLACARHQRDLERIQIRTAVDGDRARIDAVMPEAARKRGARLDLVIDLPQSVRVKVLDGSGDAEIDGVAALEIDDDSGNLRIARVAGAVSIDDDSGDVEVDGAGRVRIDDDSGDVTIQHAAAVNVIDDDSGDLSFSDIAGDVVIDDDDSGDIVVARIGGNLVVADDDGGDLEYTDVAGKVEVPEGGHRRRHSEAADDDGAERRGRELPAEAPPPAPAEEPQAGAAPPEAQPATSPNPSR